MQLIKKKTKQKKTRELFYNCFTFSRDYKKNLKCCEYKKSVNYSTSILFSFSIIIYNKEIKCICSTYHKTFSLSYIFFFF